DGGHVRAVEYVDPAGERRTAKADAFILAASPIESARLCLLSPTPSGEGPGNSSGPVGRNPVLHFQRTGAGVEAQRVHGQRGRAVSNGITDFRGVEPGGDTVRIFADGAGKHAFMGGICEFGSIQGTVLSEEAPVYIFQLGSLGASGTRA